MPSPMVPAPTAPTRFISMMAAPQPEEGKHESLTLSLKVLKVGFRDRPCSHRRSRLASGSRLFSSPFKVGFSFVPLFNPYFLREHRIEDSSASHLLQTSQQKTGRPRHPAFCQTEIWEGDHVRKSKDDSTGSGGDAGVQRLSAG